MKIAVGLTQESINVKVSGVELSVYVQEIANDITVFQSFITIFNQVIVPILPECIVSDLKDRGIKYDEITKSISLIAEYMQLMEGLNTTVVVELTYDGKIKVESITSKGGFTIDFIKLMELYAKICHMIGMVKETEPAIDMNDIIK